MAIRRDSGERKLVHLLFIGEAPGEMEDILGLPFTGYAGRILDMLIEYVQHPFSYVITNTVGCRPMDLITLGEVNKEDYVDDPSLSEAKSRARGEAAVSGQYDLDYIIENQNREPTPPEMAACSPHIDELILTEKFTGVVYLGKVARSYKTRLPSIELFHPAYIGRMEYKLLPILRQSRILDKFVEKLHNSLESK